MVETPKTEHAYDGIEEYDNPLPGWWKWIFVASIAFFPFYWVYYHGGTPGRSMEDSYNVAFAANIRLQFDEIGDLKPDSDTILQYMHKESWVRVGKLVFQTNCILCHGRDGEGKIGPNLTDDAYKNVLVIEDIARVIAEGAAAGAMPKWAERLHPNEVVLVAAYVASLRGTNVDGGRIAEGRVIAPWPDPPIEPEAEEVIDSEQNE